MVSAITMDDANGLWDPCPGVDTSPNEEWTSAQTRPNLHLRKLREEQVPKAVKDSVIRSYVRDLESHCFCIWLSL